MLASKYAKRLEGKSVDLSMQTVDVHGRMVANLEESQGLTKTGAIDKLQKAYGNRATAQEDLKDFYRTKKKVNERYDRFKFSERIFSNPFRPIARNERKVQSLTQEKQNLNTVEGSGYTLPEKLAG